MKTPGSLNWEAPLTRNSIANKVLPQPVLPQTSVGRPFGSPPLVIVSKPSIPVSTFASCLLFLGTNFCTAVAVASDLALSGFDLTLIDVFFTFYVPLY